MQPEIPNIPGYEVYPRPPLGVGGFAKVYLAKHKGFQIDVALKIMDSELAKDKEFCKRFLREGRTCAKLSTHPNIMNIYDLGCVDDSYYFSMQLLNGSSLEELLENDGEQLRETNRHPLELLRPIIEALGFAHRHGFVHRDIKPANILFNEDGESMLSDFGIAKSVNQHTLSAAGATIGTPAYMSPEQAKASSDMDGRSDHYSLGVVLFELLTGEQPYKADTPMGIMLQHVNDPIPQLPADHAKFQPLITKLMAKDPADRYKDSEALLVEFDWYISKLNQNDKFPDIRNWCISTLRRWRIPILSLVSISVLASVSFWAFKNIELPSGAPVQTDVVQPQPQPQPQPVPVPVPETAGNSRISSEVAAMLEQAELYEIIGDLVTPPGSNALDIYEAILRIEPNQQDALSGKARVIELSE